MRSINFNLSISTLAELLSPNCHSPRTTINRLKLGAKILLGSDDWLESSSTGSPRVLIVNSLDESSQFSKIMTARRICMC